MFRHPFRHPAPVPPVAPAASAPSTRLRRVAARMRIQNARDIGAAVALLALLVTLGAIFTATCGAPFDLPPSLRLVINACISSMTC
jgi:hypothetical protein